MLQVIIKIDVRRRRIIELEPRIKYRTDDRGINNERRWHKRCDA